MATLNRFKVLCIAGGFLAVAGAGAAAAVELTPMESLGKTLFFSKALSNPKGQDCSYCHKPSKGWAGPEMHGAIDTRFGGRNPPTAAYAGFNPILHKCGDMVEGEGMLCTPGEFVGGLFSDGRATGWTLGDPLAEQAQGPFLSPLEQNLASPAEVCQKVREAGHEAAFEKAWGPGALNCGVDGIKLTYDRIGRSISAFEKSTEVNTFSSKFDTFWKNSANKIPSVDSIATGNLSAFKNRGLNDEELQGLMLFNTKGNCSTCHTMRPMLGSKAPLFTDFTYVNLGFPKNPDNKFYDMPPEFNPDGKNWIDQGLGGFLATTQGAMDLNGTPRDYAQEAAMNYGKHKTPTLRNVAKRDALGYGHNGFFKNLEEIVHFYNKRDVLPVCNDTMQAGTCFPAAEVATDINRTEVGNMGLTETEEKAIVRFMKALSDGYVSPDFNNDGRADKIDYTMLVAEIRKIAPRNPAFDLNSDGQVDLLDARFFYEAAKGI